VKWPPAWDPVHLRVVSCGQFCTGGCEEKSCKSAAVKRRRYVCCSYSETVIVPALNPLPGNG
jgi:hypothetical protein